MSEDQWQMLDEQWQILDEHDDVLSSQNRKKRKYKKKTEWTKATENLLVEMWEEKIMQLRGNRKNQHVYAEIAAELQKNGLDATALDVKNKVHNLTARYRKEKLLIGPSGGSPSEWPLYSRLHSFLGSYKYYNLSEIICDSISAPLTPSAKTTEAAAPSTSSAAASFMFDQSETPSSSNHSRLMGSVASASCSPNAASSASTHMYSESGSPTMLSPMMLSPTMELSSSTSMGSGTARLPEKGKKFQNQIMQRIDNASQQMEQHVAIMQEIGNKLVNEEREKKELLKALITKQSAVMDAMLHCMNNMK